MTPISKLPSVLSTALAGISPFNSAAGLDASLSAMLVNEAATGTPEEKFLTLTNLLRQLGQYPEVLSQIVEIVGIGRSYAELRVSNCDDFLLLLDCSGFVVNHWLEALGRLGGSGHKFDSARFITRHRSEPQLHLANDRGADPGYGREYFFLHWDSQSVLCEKPSIIGTFLASRSHGAPAAPELVAAYLDSILS